MAKLENPDGSPLVPGTILHLPTTPSLAATRCPSAAEYVVRHTTATQVRAVRTVPDPTGQQLEFSFRRDSGLLIGGTSRRRYAVVATPEMIDAQRRVQQVANIQEALRRFTERMTWHNADRYDEFWLGLDTLAGDYIRTQVSNLIDKK